MGAEDYYALLSLARARFGHLSHEQWSVKKAELERQIDALKAGEGASGELMGLELDLYLLGLVPTNGGGGVDKVGRVQ